MLNFNTHANKEARDASSSTDLVLLLRHDEIGDVTERQTELENLRVRDVERNTSEVQHATWLGFKSYLHTTAVSETLCMRRYRHMRSTRRQSQSKRQSFIDK